MQWTAKWIFPWLLRCAMTLGAWAFGKFDARGHGWQSRRWMWRNVWQPMIRHASESETKVDDQLSEFVYANQSCCLEDGSALATIGAVRQAIAESDPVTAYAKLDILQRKLGIRSSEV